MKFGKIVNGALHICPSYGADGYGRMHTNLPKYYEAATDRDGWMEVIETAIPQGSYEPSYEVKNGNIVQHWIEVEPSPIITSIDDRLELVENCILEISDVLSDIMFGQEFGQE